MSNNQFHQIEIDHGLIALIKAMTQQTSTEIVCTLFEAVQPSYAKITSGKSKSHWTTKKVTYPGTPLILNSKTRFGSQYKYGAATSTFTLYNRKPVIFTQQQVEDMMVEQILLGFYAGEIDE